MGHRCLNPYAISDERRGPRNARPGPEEGGCLPAWGGWYVVWVSGEAGDATGYTKLTLFFTSGSNNFRLSSIMSKGQT